MRAGTEMAYIKRTAALVLFLLGFSFLAYTPVAATLQGLQVGMPVPDFTVKDLHGANKKLSEVQGDKLTAVVFWSTSSAKSEKNLLKMQELYREYRDLGLTVVAISAEGLNVTPQSLAEAGETAARLDLTYPVFVDDGLAAFHAAGVIALPTTIVLDRERVIGFELAGYPLVGAEEMVSYLATNFAGGKPAVSAPKQPLANKDALRYFQMGKKTLQSRRMAETAEDWFKKAVDADPRFVQPYLSLGEIYLQRGDVSQARNQFEQVLVREPTNVVALCELGVLLAKAGEPGQGLAMFDKALATDEAYPPCYYYRGAILELLGDREQAGQMYDAALANNPRDHLAYVYKARALEGGGQLREAADAYREALGLLLNLTTGTE
jgi:tetratricopeptide (TPR) repeat protein